MGRPPPPSDSYLNSQLKNVFLLRVFSNVPIKLYAHSCMIYISTPDGSCRRPCMRVVLFSKCNCVCTCCECCVTMFLVGTAADGDRPLWRWLCLFCCLSSFCCCCVC